MTVDAKEYHRIYSRGYDAATRAYSSPVECPGWKNARWCNTHLCPDGGYNHTTKAAIAKAEVY